MAYEIDPATILNFYNNPVDVTAIQEGLASSNSRFKLIEGLAGAMLGKFIDQNVHEPYQHKYLEDITPNQYHAENHLTSPYFAASYPIPRENAPALHDSLWRHAEEMVVSEHIVLAEGRQKPPKSLGDYRFVPVLHPDPDFLEYSVRPVCTDLETSQGVTFEYAKPGGMPFMDGRLGLGLAFRDRLVALCSGGIAKEGPIILQLQDVSNKIPPATTDSKILRSFAYSNGLRGGIDWKATLVHGWSSLMSKALPEVLPETVGMPVWVQCAENNNWVNRQVYTDNGQAVAGRAVDYERLARFSNTYDMTARLLGGVLDPRTRNSELPTSFAVGQAV